MPTLQIVSPTLVSTLPPTQFATSTVTDTPTPTQTVVPTQTPTITPVPTLESFSGVPIPEQIKLQAAVESYARAMGTTPETVKVTFQQKKDIQGNRFVVAVAADGTPLLIASPNKDGKYEWQEATLRALADKVGIKVGTSVDGSEDYRNPTYRKTVTDNFSLIMPDGSFMLNTLAKWGDGMARDFAQLAYDNGLSLRILDAFHYTDLEQPLMGNLKTPEQLEGFMRDRLRKLFGFVQKGSKTEVIIVHESTVQYWNGQVHWQDNPFYKAFGKDWPIEAYTMAYQVAKEDGLTVGEDVVFAFSDYDFMQNPPKADAVYDLLDRTRKGVAQNLGMRPEDVRINVRSIQISRRCDFAPLMC